MSIPFGIEWAPAFRQLADISQLIFTIGPFLFVGIFVILKIRSKREDEDVLYNAVQLEPLDNYNKAELVKIDRSDIPFEYAADVKDTIAMADYGTAMGLSGKCYAIKYHQNYVGMILVGKAVEDAADPIEVKGRKFFRIMGFFIQSKYQGLGIGTLALQKAIDSIYYEYGNKTFLLECHKDNEKAISFYEKNGFVNTGKLNAKGTDYFMILEI